MSHPDSRAPSWNCPCAINFSHVPYMYLTCAVLGPFKFIRPPYIDLPQGLCYCLSFTPPIYCFPHTFKSSASLSSALLPSFSREKTFVYRQSLSLNKHHNALLHPSCFGRIGRALRWCPELVRPAHLCCTFSSPILRINSTIVLTLTQARPR